MMSKKLAHRQRVAVVYHYFAHFRAAVMSELLHSPSHDYLLVAESHDATGGREAWKIPPTAPFVEAPCQYLRSNIMVQKGLLRLAMRRDLQTIIYLANVYYLSTWLSAAVARLTGKRVLFWGHGWRGHEGRPKLLFRRIFYKLAHGLLLYGHGAKMIGIAQGFAPEKLHVIYNSLDYEAQKTARAGVTSERIAQVRRELFANPQHPLLICTTRLTTVRRLDLLLEAMLELRQRGHEVNLLLVGEGPERASLESMSAAHDLPVKFYGACYDEQVLAELFMAADLTVSPGAIGLTAIHSLAFGTPVLSHDDASDQGPEWEAIIPGRTGILFKRNNVADLARAIEEWNQRAPSRSQVRDDCYRLVERFYNPVFQRIAIDRAVSGKPADDLFWMREGIADFAKTVPTGTPALSRNG